MDYLPIPFDVLDSESYQSLTPGDKYFLIELYALYFDCERFTINADRPQDYRQPPKANLCRKIGRLVDCGLLRAVDLAKNGNNHYQRVFAFTYSALGALDRAA